MNCPVEGKCQTEGVIYRATVKEVTSGKEETYTGMTGRKFKDRLYEHRTNENTDKPKNRQATKLSDHIWKLKDSGIDYQIQWRILDRATTYNPTT